MPYLRTFPIVQQQEAARHPACQWVYGTSGALHIPVGLHLLDDEMPRQRVQFLCHVLRASLKVVEWVVSLTYQQCGFIHSFIHSLSGSLAPA